MKLDDRFMTIMTALLLIIGIAAVMHRGEDGTSIFGGSGNYKAKEDAFTLRAGRIQTLDVLLNDSGVERIDPADLRITRMPECGTSTAVDGAIQYSSDTTCSGTIGMAYCVAFDGSCDSVPVTLTVLNIETGGGTAPDVASGGTGGAPLVYDVVQQGNAPQQQPQIAMKQPMRLSLPVSSEVVTPSEATAEIRRMGGNGGQAVAVNTSDTMVTVSNTSARSGSVATAGISMSAPSLDDGQLDVALAAPSAPTANPLRPSAPGGLGLSGPTQPQPSLPSVALEIPTGPSLSGPSSGDAGTETASVALPGSSNPTADPAPRRPRLRSPPHR